MKPVWAMVFIITILVFYQSEIRLFKVSYNPRISAF